MTKIGRNEPCPCGSGKKYKRCCAATDEAAARARTAPTYPQAFLTSPSAEKSLPVIAAQWPVARAYVPVEDVWRATGLGMAGTIRRQPDGRFTQVLFTFSLQEHGLGMMCGKGDMTLEEADQFLSGLRHETAPFEEGPPELASQYIWGAWALGEKEGAGFPPRETAPYLAVVPKPPGSPKDWLDKFIGPRGLSSTGLVEIIRELPPPELAGEKMEIAVFSATKFRLANPRSVVSRIGSSAPNAKGFRFIGGDPSEHQGIIRFEWVRPIPKGPRSMAPVRGDFQIQGWLEIRDDELLVMALSLSMAARLLGDLKGMFGQSIVFVGAEWGNPSRPSVATSRPGIESWIQPGARWR